MPRNNIKFNVSDGGLGVQPATEDHVSGIIYTNIQFPSSWTTEIRSFRSLAQAEQAGITDTNVNYIEVHYQIKEYFRLRPDGELYVGFLSTLDEDKIFAQTDGRVRQWGFFGDLTTASSAQTLMDKLALKAAPSVAVVGYTPTLDPNALVDLTNSNYAQVAVLVVGDGGAVGGAIAKSLGISCLPVVGAWLGATALASVHESTAWVDKFNMSDGLELESPLLATGDLLKATLGAIQDELHDKGYTFLQKHIGRTGSYFNDNKTATDSTSDYSSVNNNRTIQKAIRGLRAALLSELSSPVEVDPDTGQLSVGYIEYLKTKGENPLFLMQADGELSGYSLTIDSTQNVLATSTVELTVKLVPKGVARNIIVNIGLAANV